MTSARDLSAQLADLLRRERAALSEFLLALADFDRQRRWLELGHASLFYFLHRELGLSAGAAFYRKSAAELIQKFPEVIEPLRDGRLCLTSVVELSKVLTRENLREVLPRFFQLSKRDAKAVVAALRPDDAPPRREVVTPLRVPVAAAPGVAPSAPARATAPVPNDSSPTPFHPDETVHADARVRDVVPATPPARTVRTEADPLTAELSRLHVTVSKRFLRKLEAARAALSHSHPRGGTEELLEAGLDLLLERHAKRKGLVERPRGEGVQRRSEHVPAHVKRAVWKRDGGRCQWPVQSGGICGSTHQVELDHIVPRARGGVATVENTRCLCRVHNDLAARREYGDAWMDQFTRRERAPVASGAAPAPPP